MYFIHSLLTEHIEILTKKSGSKTLSEVLTELGPPPPQLPRKDNANVELLLLNRYQGKGSADGKEMKPEKMYSETKYLLFTIIKSIPELSESAENDLKLLLQNAQKYAIEKNDFQLTEKVKKIEQNCKKLVMDGIISESDSYAKLRRDTVQELVNYEAQIQKTNFDLERLKTVLKNIHDHNEFLKQQFEAYKQYLANVREKSVTNPKKEKHNKGPFKFSHVKLQQDGVIIESEVPEERRSNIFFSFSSSSPGIFEIAVLYKSRNISTMSVQLDDLLERQHNNNLEYETDFLKLNINLLIFLLNKSFMS